MVDERSSSLKIVHLPKFAIVNNRSLVATSPFFNNSIASFVYFVTTPRFPDRIAGSLFRLSSLSVVDMLVILENTNVLRLQPVPHVRRHVIKYERLFTIDTKLYNIL